MYQKTVTLQNGTLLEFDWEEGLANMTNLSMGTRSEAPRPKRRPFSGSNAPLDSDL
jgi:hypothetical protein